MNKFKIDINLSAPNMVRPSVIKELRSFKRNKLTIGQDMAPQSGEIIIYGLPLTKPVDRSHEVSLCCLFDSDLPEDEESRGLVNND